MHYGTNPNPKGTAEEYIEVMGKSPTKVLEYEVLGSVKF
jgi:hypothetical protein